MLSERCGNEGDMNWVDCWGGTIKWSSFLAPVAAPNINMGLKNKTARDSLRQFEVARTWHHIPKY
jgi:hypothetical protein